MITGSSAGCVEGESSCLSSSIIASTLIPLACSAQIMPVVIPVLGL